MTVPSPERQAIEAEITDAVRGAKHLRRWLAGGALLVGLLTGYTHWNDLRGEEAITAAGILIVGGAGVAAA